MDFMFDIVNNEQFFEKGEYEIKIYLDCKFVLMSRPIKKFKPFILNNKNLSSNIFSQINTFSLFP